MAIRKPKEVIIREPKAVKREIRLRVLRGYPLSRTIDSCEDHACDFFAIEESTFMTVVRDALRERQNMLRKSS